MEGDVDCLPMAKPEAIDYLGIRRDGVHLVVGEADRR